MIQIIETVNELRLKSEIVGLYWNKGPCGIKARDLVDILAKQACGDENK